MLYTLKGLVVRENIATENAKYIHILTAEKGKLSVLCRGSTRARGRFSVPTQLFCYSEFVLYEHNGKYSLNEASLIENYFYLCRDFTAVTLGTYILNTAEFLVNEEQPDGGILRLALNTLWMLAHGKEKDLRLIKGTYELRLAALAGFAPNLIGCESCGHGVGEDKLYLNVMEGSLICAGCQALVQKEVYRENELLVNEMRTTQIILPLQPATVLAMQYAIWADMSRLYSFSLDPMLIPEFSSACEKYLLNHIDHHFPVLDMLIFG